MNLLFSFFLECQTISIERPCFIFFFHFLLNLLQWNRGWCETPITHFLKMCIVCRYLYWICHFNWNILKVFGGENGRNEENFSDIKWKNDKIRVCIFWQRFTASFVDTFFLEEHTIPIERNLHNETNICKILHWNICWHIVAFIFYVSKMVSIKMFLLLYEIQGLSIPNDNYSKMNKSVRWRLLHRKLCKPLLSIY